MNINKQNTIDNIARVKMQLIINKDLYDDSYINEEKFRYIENRLIDKLHKLESLICVECEV